MGYNERSVDISSDGNIIIIGSSKSFNRKGSVIVYEYNNSNQTWEQKGNISNFYPSRLFFWK